jgi:O-succinylbenzoic acid--CoA ligase
MNEAGSGMLDPLGERASVDPLAPALIDGIEGGVITWAELDDLAQGLAGRLSALGIGAGDRIALVEPAGPALVVALHACVRLGAAVVPLSPRLPAAELRRHLDDCAARVVLTSGEAAPAVVSVSERAGRDGLGVWSFDDSVRNLDEVPSGVAPRGAYAESRDVAVIYTSGASGRPKGVRLTVGNCVASAAGCSEALGGISVDDRWLLVLGPHRVGGLAILWRSVLSGAAAVYVSRFDERSSRAALSRGPSLASFVPTMLLRLLDAGNGGALSSLRAILVGGSPVSGADVLAWTERGLTVCASYGMTETGSQIAVVPPGRADELAGSAGFVHSRAAIEVDSRDTPFGELLVGGAVLSPGYLDGTLTTRAFIGDGAERRLRTGDIGFVKSGVVRVIGRRDRMIITGGEKVNPEEVEAVLRDHPGVRDAAVTGASDARYGKIVVAAVVGVVDAVTLQRWCRERLASYKVPRRFQFAETLPRSEDGKMLWQRADDRML